MKICFHSQGALQVSPVICGVPEGPPWSVVIGGGGHILAKEQLVFRTELRFRREQGCEVKVGCCLKPHLRQNLLN